MVQDSESRVGPAAHDVLKTVSLVTLAMWLGYPLMILLGADGVQAIPTKAELGCLTLLDLSAKVPAAPSVLHVFLRRTRAAGWRLHISAVQRRRALAQSQHEFAMKLTA